MFSAPNKILTVEYWYQIFQFPGLEKFVNFLHYNMEVVVAEYPASPDPSTAQDTQKVNVEATARRLNMTGHGVLILVTIYLLPKKKFLRSDLETLFALGDAVILFGDLDSKTNALKTEESAPIPALTKPDNYIAFDNREKAEYLADSIE
ncbi:hypothetical protein EVAR_56608_1 [Eumeta japonica]|uniref:Uncharacterized protein n=1 Tax=Eumeta variegata TaxID=151549 RepID=A0A4C1Z0P0_EUMVA|nr:hypothetical protein EVAR_56608_1 [Eumeta japonica]